MRSSPSRGTCRTKAIRLSVTGLVVAASGGLVAVSGPTASAAACTDVQVVAARGTAEPGDLGTIVGDRVLDALKNKLSPLKSTSGYRVNYPADLSLTSVAQGNLDLVNHLKSQASSCPDQKFVLVGYSQGANVVDNSIGVDSSGAVVGGPIVATIPNELEPKVAAVLLFGNPIRSIGKSVTGTYASRTKDFCAKGDPICEKGGGDVGAHLGYWANADEAATFAQFRV